MKYELHFDWKPSILHPCPADEDINEAFVRDTFTNVRVYKDGEWYSSIGTRCEDACSSNEICAALLYSFESALSAIQQGEPDNPDAYRISGILTA